MHLTYLVAHSQEIAKQIKSNCLIQLHTSEFLEFPNEPSIICLLLDFPNAKALAMNQPKQEQKQYRIEALAVLLLPRWFLQTLTSLRTEAIGLSDDEKPVRRR